MEESQSPNLNKQTPVSVEEAGVQFDPGRGGVSAWYRGGGSNPIMAIILSGFFGLALTSILMWNTLGVFAPILLILSFVMYAGISLLWLRGHHIPHPSISSSTRTISIQGFTEEALLKSGLLGALIQRVECGQLKLPEPDAKADSKSGKRIPFRTGEKEKLIQEQKELETEITAVTSTVSTSQDNYQKLQ